MGTQSKEVKTEVRPQWEFRFGVKEQEPEVKKDCVTVRQTTEVWIEKQKKFVFMGLRYSEMPTKVLQEEVREWIATGKQVTTTERIEKLKKIIERNKRKNKK
jgi:hypothetical protein